MALSKAIDTNYGAQATYWRIIRVHFDVIARTVWFVLGGYTDAAARGANKTPLREQPFTMNLADNQTPEDIGRAEMYAFAKTAEVSGAVMFSGAADV